MSNFQKFVFGGVVFLLAVFVVVCAVYFANQLGNINNALANIGTEQLAGDLQDPPQATEEDMGVGVSLPTPMPPEALEQDATEVVIISHGESTVDRVFEATDALLYPELQAPDPSRQPVFPDVAYGNRPELVAYEEPFEDGDYCDNTPCGMDVPQYYFRVMTAGEVTIPDLGVNCIATDLKGCLVIVINHFGETAMYRGNTIDHGFTIAGRVWDMETPADVVLAGQALLDHYTFRMTVPEDGANCGTIDACELVEWHVVVIGNAEAQVHWTGLFNR